MRAISSRGAVVAMGCVLLLVGVGCTSARPEAALSVMSFNVRVQLVRDGENQWTYRRDAVGQMLNQRRPDLLGLQEVAPAQLDDLAAMLPGYCHVGVGREGGSKGEHAPIFYRTDRFELLESGHFWLGANTTQPVAGWDAMYPRLATWAKLRDRHTGRQLVMLNTHLDHHGREARREGAKLIAARLKALTAGPMIVTGDFNTNPQSPAYQAMIDAGLRDARIAAGERHQGPVETAAGWPQNPVRPILIDYIFVSPELKVHRSQTLPADWHGRTLSDHSAIMAILE